jgi:hypothetical protein
MTSNNPEQAAGKVPRKIQFGDVMGIFFHQAAMALGAIPHPSSGELFISFEMAQESISILEIIQEKTKGNLTEEESSTLENTLRELKLAYVHAINDPELRQMMEQQGEEHEADEQKQTSRIITPDGRPASTNEKPRIIIP